MIYIIQVDAHGIPVTEAGYQSVEAVKYTNWFNNDTKQTAMTMVGTDILTLKHLFGDRYAQVPQCYSTPVGTIEFAEAFLGKVIKPLNIPKQLSGKQFTCREMGTGNKNDLKKFMDRLSLQRVFVKSNTRCKIRPVELLYRGQVDQYCEDEYLYSEDISESILSEWRVFVRRKEILDCRMYIGDWCSIAPDANAVQNMVSAYTDCPPAYTLDVANIATPNGVKTVVIEVHNFIDCGLYGFTDERRILGMLSAAYKWQASLK